MEKIDAVDWVRQLSPLSNEPPSSTWSISPVSHHGLFERVSRLAGEPAAQWAVQAADRIAHFQRRRYPRWATNDLEHRSNRIGPEAMALISLDFLASGRFSPGVITEAVERMMSARHARYAPLKMLLQSSADNYARLAQEYFYACNRLVEPEHQLKAAETISWALLTCVREYTEAVVTTHSTHSGQQPIDDLLLRNSMVEKLLRGDDGNVSEVEDRINYQIQDREHRFFIGWANPDDTESLHRLQHYFSQLADQPNGSAALLIPQPAMGEMWLWTSTSRRELNEGAEYPSLPEGVRAATASAGPGISGFRISQSRAMEVRRATSSFRFPPHRVTEYSEVCAVLQFAGNEIRAAEFAVEELGELSSHPARYELERQALATQLRTQNISDAARELFVSRSTVSYRLRKASQLMRPGFVGGSRVTEREWNHGPTQEQGTPLFH